MFETTANKSRLEAAFSMMDVIYHATVFNVRKSHSNALIGLLLNMLQTMILVLVFYLMFVVLGMREAAIRGDFLLYIMSGIFMYVTNIKTVSAVAGAEGSTSRIMQHAPMNSFVAIVSTALSALYMQVLSVLFVFLIYSLLTDGVVIYKPALAFSMVLLSWFNGVAIGIIFLAAKPWFPKSTPIVRQFYTRANMIASGKMFLANSMPLALLSFFMWNPLFHIIDQARGFAFINYNPHYSSVSYPIIASLALALLGLMAENYTRKHASLSWGARA